MANNKHTDNSGKTTAGDLLSRLNRRSSDIIEAENAAEQNDVAAPEEKSLGYDPQSASDESEIDVNELLRNYLPQYADDDSESDDAAEAEADREEYREEIPEEAPKKRESLLARLKRVYSQGSSSEETDSEEESESAEDDSFELVENLPSDEDSVEDGELEENEEIDVALEESEEETVIADSEEESEDASSSEETPAEEVLPEDGSDEISAEYSENISDDSDLLKVFSLSDLADMADESSEESQAGFEETAEEAEVPDWDNSEDIADGETESSVEEMAEEQSEEIPEEAPMDKTDLNLILAFGLEEELSRTMGPKAAEQLKKELDAERKKKKRQEHEYEFTNKNQIGKIAEAYRYTKRSLLIKLGIAAVLALVLCFYENLTILGIQFAGVFDPAVYPVVYVMGSLQLLLLIAAVAYEQIIFGLKRLFTFRPTPESVSAALVLFAVIFSVASALNIELNVEPKMYNFPAALSIVVTLLYSYINLKREIFTFNVVSSKRPKFAVTSNDSGSEDYDAVLKIDQTEFVDGYFARTYEDSPVASLIVGITLAVSVIASVLIAVYVNLKGGSTALSLNSAYITLLAALPVSIVITYCYPFFLASKNAFAMDCAIIGEGALGEFSDASVVCFEDKDLFSPKGVKVQNIRIYNNRRIDRVLYYAASVFSHTKGPLSEVFEVATADIGHSEDVKVEKCGEGILECSVDGRKILFGTSQSIAELSLEIPEDVLDEDQYASEEISIMYMFIDDMLAAKMYVRYNLDPDFENTLDDLDYSDMGMCINTYDPNISDAMVSARLNIGDIPLRVVKYSPDDSIPAGLDHADSGIVSRGSPKYLIRTISLCEKVLSVRRTNTVLAVLSMLLAAALVFIIAMSGNAGSLLSLYVALYQIIWIAPMLLTSKLFVS